MCIRDRDVLRQLPARQRVGGRAEVARPRCRAPSALHAYADRRAECQRTARVFRLQQRARVFRHAPALVDKLLDSSWLMKAATSGSITTDPGSLGELTISMLKGEDGFQRREFDKLMEWLV